MCLNNTDTPSTIDYDELKTFIINRLKKDTTSADMKWSIFVAALSSYRHASVLKPFPKISTIPILTDIGEFTSKEYQQLLGIVERVPRFSRLKDIATLTSLDDEAVELLHWVLASPLYDITSCDKNVYSELVEKAQQIVAVTPPSAIFQITYPSLYALSSLRQPLYRYGNAFEKRSEGKKTFHAYHGSRFDNFHSILSYGLQGSLNKNALFGDGTYLSNELSVSLNYCPLGQGWAKSELGELLSCLAYCDIIDDPLVKYGTSTSSNKSHVKGCIGGSIPEKYYVVQNSDALRVRYILLYGSGTVLPEYQSASAAADSPVQRRQPRSWFSRNKMMFGGMVYVMVLAAVSSYNSTWAQSYMNGWHRRYFGRELL